MKNNMKKFFFYNYFNGKEEREKGSGGERKKCDSCKQTLICWLKRERGEGNVMVFVIYHFI